MYGRPYANISRCKKVDIYLLPWVDIQPVNEFRVFVCNNKITAISQQNLHYMMKKVFKIYQTIFK